MLYGNASALAFRAAIYLSLQPPDKLVPVREVAKQAGLPEPYLAKIVRQLASAGLVRAFRGPGGGVHLARSPREIALADIVRAVDGAVQQDWCVLGLQPCSDDHPCPLHPAWAPLQAGMIDLLEKTTLAALTDGLRHNLKLDEKSWVRLPAERLRPSDRKRSGRNANRQGAKRAKAG